MKEKLFILLILSIGLKADYELFESQTKEIRKVVKNEEVYFGSYKGFKDKLAEGVEGGLTKALFSGISSGYRCWRN